MSVLLVVMGLAPAAAEYRPTLDGLQRCSTVKDEYNIPRTGFKTPREIVNMGKITAFRPRTDWVIVHDFAFTEGENYAVVNVEMGKGYGGAYALSQMCIEHGAPAGCPDLRSAFGSQHDWSDPATREKFVRMYNATLDPRCNTPGVPFPVKLEMEDMCLHDKTDDDYWYVWAMFDLELSRACQGAPPSCRMAKIGKPGGRDSHFWGESWDAWGALDINATHVKRMVWSMCPTEMVGAASVPCNFGSKPGADNCDDWFEPNIAPAKRDPPEPWPPLKHGMPLVGMPDGLAVEGYFCANTQGDFVHLARRNATSTKLCGTEQSTGNKIYVPLSVDCKALPPKLEKCNLDCKLPWGLAWAGLAAVVGGALLCYLRIAAPHAKVRFDTTILYLYAGSLAFESVSFIAMTLSLHLYAAWKWDEYAAALNAVSVLQIMNGVLIWTVAVYMLRFDRVNNLRSILKYTGSAGLFFIFVFMILAALDSPLKNGVFLLWFEPVFWLRLGSALVIAGSVPKVHDWAVLFVATKFVLVLFHLYSIALELNPGYERDWSYPVTRLVHILVEPFAAFALVQMARNGAFTPKEREFLIPTTAQAETVLLREKALAKASEASQVTWRTHFVFPERLWSYGAIGMVIGYFASGSLLIAVTKPNVMRDPIYNMYATYHTCMLLDYLPGAFAAYVFFGWLVLCQQACALSTFVRTALSGSAMLTIASATSSMFLYFVCASFPLVFVLSPGMTTVLAHSIPYMLHQAGIATFMFVGIFQVSALSKNCKSVTYRMRLHYKIYASLYVIVVTYGLAFMFTTLLENLGMGDNSDMPKRAATLAMEAYADRDGSISLMENIHECDGADGAVLDLPHPWGYVPSELVGTARVFTAVNDSSATRGFLKLANMTIDGFGVANVTATVLSAGAATAMAAASSALTGTPAFTPAAPCDAATNHVFTQRIHSMCRARALEDPDGNWYVLHAMSTDEIETQCVGAGAARLASAPPKFASGTAKGACRQLMLGKAAGKYHNQLRESAAVTDAMVSDGNVVHLRWSVCPDQKAADMTTERGWTFEDGELKPQLDIPPLLATLLIVVFIVSFRWVHPLRNMPLAMEVTSYVTADGKADRPALQIPKVQHKGSLAWDTDSTFFAVFTARSLFRFGMLLLLAAAVLAHYLDGAVYGKAWVEQRSLRELLRTQPGASVAATLYTIFAGMTLVSVLLELYHQHLYNTSLAMRKFGYVAAGLMAFGLLIGPTSLVPGAIEYWSVFYGVNILQMALVNWLMYQSALLWQTDGLTCGRILETAVAAITVVLLLISMASTDNNKLDAAFLFALTVWSMTDARGLTFHIVNIRVSDEADMTIVAKNDEASLSLFQPPPTREAPLDLH